MTEQLYLDSAATSPVRAEVLQAMWPHLTHAYGNPSSRHERGTAAAEALRAARVALAQDLGCRPAEIVFTSGGTEADNLAVKGIALAAPRGRHLIVSAIEHEAVREAAEQLRRLHGFALTVLDVDSEGRVPADALAAALRPDTTLVSIQHASNEIGTVQAIRELAEVAHAAAVPFHSDAVQSAGWVPLHRDALDVDALSIAGHKLGAPAGVGALVLRRGVPLEPLMSGGGQERGLRSGTENVAGAVALATAVRLATRESTTVHEVAHVRDALIDGVLARVPGALLTGARSDRLPHHASFCFPGTSGETVLLELERRGVACSSGSACAAGSDEPSPTLLALGIPPEHARTAVRLTLPHGLPADPRSFVADVVERIARAVEAVGALASPR